MESDEFKTAATLCGVIGGGEAAIGLKLGKPVVGLLTAWNLKGMKKALMPGEAVKHILAEMSSGLV